MITIVDFNKEVVYNRDPHELADKLVFLIFDDRAVTWRNFV